MGQREGINSSKACPLTPRLKKSLIPQGIKNSLNLNVKPRIIYVAMSLIIILIAPFLLPLWIPSSLVDPVSLLLLSFGQIILLGAVWKILSEIIEFSNLKPGTIYVAMSLIIILIFGRTYLYSIISFYPGDFLALSLLEIVVLAAVGISLSGVREFNKRKTSFAEIDFAIGVDWQWVLIGFSFLLFLLGAYWYLLFSNWSPLP